ncbi:GntR family transcriptional regulator [Branchiibius hedensis]|uniref:Transcriptional regulator, GntR family n=1 Tax=Branchiibius hedensis TaxID=672460 RepID=A0A2Y9BTC9_9MICO|nr:GntR family transcriptional regulator [Branchiibius hedensis]PWJ25017.1 GntR family transcriptional regulator [Branchiibius hedensis]SSA33832.1 transcriptional regulator, GntR family [Branchiibius hedensis]
MTSTRLPTVELPPVQGGAGRQGTAENIIEQVVAAIADGTLARGQRLPSEREFARHYGVSGPTAREAIRALSAMGLVEARHGSGTYVTADPEVFVSSALTIAAHMSDVTVSEIIDLLAVLNVHAAEAACEAATEQEVDALAAASAGIVNAEQPSSILTSVTDFHRALARAAHRPLIQIISTFLVDTLADLEERTFPVDSAFWQEWTGALAAHRAEIVSAVRAHDPGRAGAAVRAYHREAGRMLADESDLLSARTKVK